MKATYENLPGLDPHAKKPMVTPMLFRDNQLDIRKMMDMMAITDKEGPVPLYVEVSYLLFCPVRTSPYRGVFLSHCTRMDLSRGLSDKALGDHADPARNGD